MPVKKYSKKISKFDSKKSIKPQSKTITKTNSKKSSKLQSKKSSKLQSNKSSKLQSNKSLFFLDIFNQLLKYNEKKIIIIFDTGGNIWFGLRDIFNMLGYNNINNAINTIKISDANRTSYKDIRVSDRLDTLINMQPHKIFINESGLYEVLTKSTKPIANLFMQKYLIEIMPEIRKTGKYIMNSEDKSKLDNLNNKISNYKKELNFYNEKYNFEPGTKGLFYIKKKYIYKNGEKILCWKFGFSDELSIRFSNYLIGEFEQNLVAYIPLTIDARTLENCVKNKLKPHLLKLRTETVCYLNLKELKNEISNCINDISNHICHCVLCKKKYDFKSMDEHNCNKKLSSVIINN